MPHGDDDDVNMVSYKRRNTKKKHDDIVMCVCASDVCKFFDPFYMHHNVYHWCGAKILFVCVNRDENVQSE